MVGGGGKLKVPGEDDWGGMRREKKKEENFSLEGGASPLNTSRVGGIQPGPLAPPKTSRLPGTRYFRLRGIRCAPESLAQRNLPRWYWPRGAGLGGRGLGHAGARQTAGSQSGVWLGWVMFQGWVHVTPAPPKLGFATADCMILPSRPLLLGSGCPAVAPVQLPNLFAPNDCDHPSLLSVCA